MPTPATKGQLQTRLEDMKIGDFIACRYKAGGYFSELGICVAPELPLNGCSTPDGLFYFIKADIGLLIADRVVQTNISYDALNILGLIQGKITPAFYGLSVFNKDFKNTNGFTWESVGGANITNSELRIGDGKYLQTPRTDYFDVGTSDFTIESYVTLLADGSCYPFWCGAPGSGSHQGGFGVWVSNENVGAALGLVNGSAIASQYNDIKSIGTLIKTGEKIHFAFVRKAGLAYLYINGKLQTLKSWSGNNNIDFNCNASNDANVYIGHYHDTFNGDGNSKSAAISNFIFSRFAKYTCDFVPSTDYSEQTNLVRSLTGGNSCMNENGKSGFVEKGLGAWPANNEFDKYITNSDLNNTIAAGDDNVWHSDGSYNVRSWTQDTPVLSLIPANNRVYRKNKMLGYDISSLVNSGLGFRPVLEYLEQNSKASTLFY